MSASNPKSPIFTKENTIKGEAPVIFPKEDNKAISLNDLVISNSIQENQNIASTGELLRGASGNIMSILEPEQYKKQPSFIRSGVEMNYLSKITFQESDPEAQSVISEVIQEEDFSSNVLAARENNREGIRQSKSNPVEEGQSIERSAKKPSFKSLFKDTFKKSKKRQKRGKENAEEKRSPIRMKTLGDLRVANEFGEEETQKINQVVMPEFNLNTVFNVNLAGSQMLDIAQEENPLGDGQKKITLDQSMRPTMFAKAIKSKSADDNRLYQNQIIEIATSKSPEKLKEIIEESESARKLKFHAKAKSSSTLGLIPFNNSKPVYNERGFIQDLLAQRERSLGEKLFQVFSLTFVYATLFYILVPLGIFFIANDYNNKNVLTYFNFGMLGLLQGVTEIIMIYKIVDVPIMKRIKDIEGSNIGLIEQKKYRVLTVLQALLILVWTIGTQICIGVIIRALNKEVNYVNILVGMICNTALGGALWLLLTILQNPPISENKKKILNKQLQQIGEIRKHFMEDLYQTRRKLQRNPRDFTPQPSLTEGKVQTEMHMAHLGALASIKSNLKIDMRRFRHKTDEFAGELVKMRLRILRVYFVLLFVYCQMIAQLSLLNVLTDNTGEGIAFVMLGVALFVGILFGSVGFFFKGGRHLLPSLKVFSLMINAGIYRFFFFTVTSRGVMAGVVAIQFVYKIIAYYVFFFGFDRIHGLWKNKIGKIYFNKDIMPRIYFFNSEEEKEAAQIKFQRYILHKFIVSQNADLFFALSTLLLLLCSRYWLQHLNFGLDLRISEFNFYLGLVILEMWIDFIMWVHFVIAAKKVLQKKVVVLNVSLVRETLRILEGRTLVIASLKVVIMFLFLFIFMNNF